MPFKKGHKINLGRKRPFQVRQFCINGHDTFVCGRDKDRGCNDCRPIWDKKYADENKRKIRIRHRKYRRKNKDKINKQKAIYLINNPDKFYVYYRKVGTRFSHAKSYAKKNNYKWELTLEEYTNLLSKPCYYCGSLLTDEMGVGLDRINNDKKIGYILSNVLPCCGLCNVTRQDNFAVEEMILIGKVIKRIKKSRES